MSNYLFLDVDNVLNHYGSEEDFDRYNVSCLKQLCDFIDFRIVLSSDRRMSPRKKAVVKSELKHVGLELHSCTPHIIGGHRKDEIKEWLREDDHFSGLILDDLGPDECDPKLPNLLFYRTDYKLGLTEQDVDSILEKLKGLPPRS
jgi:hypothetical protein